MKKRDARLYLDDILESIKLIGQYSRGISLEDFSRDPKLQDAIVRRLEIIGEAAKQVPQSFKDQHHDIPWKKMAGMRDVVIHEYFVVRLDRVWLTLQEDLPPLKRQLEDLPELQEE